MDFGDFGWRDLIWLAAVLAIVYFGVSLRGLVRLRRQPVSASPDLPPGDGQVAMPTVPIEPIIGAGAAAHPESDRLPMFETELSARLAKSELETEVRQLRLELATLREELAELKLTRRVSPLYAEAAALAQRGFDARGVAEECGISVAEAELVLAMTRDNKDFDREVDDGAVGK
jgi:hypothetical protein